MSRKLALIIGNSEYEDPSLARLITPAADVEDLAQVLKVPDIGGFDEVLTLVNESASTLRRSIARLFAQKGPDDLLLLYFSGHGVLDDQGQLYLAVKDTERELLSGSAIPATFITSEMDRSRSKRQVLILDCCHSGAFARGAKGVGTSVGTGRAFEGSGYGRVVLTATDSTQYAWEGDKLVGQAAKSVFTHYVIEGLRTGEADADGDGWIALEELYDYVYDRVLSEKYRQKPGKWAYKQEGKIILAKDPFATQKAEARRLAEQMQQARAAAETKPATQTQTKPAVSAFERRAHSSLFIMTMGWGLSGGLARLATAALSSNVGWYFGLVIACVTTSLALWRLRAFTPWKQALAIPMGWLVGLPIVAVLLISAGISSGIGLIVGLAVELLAVVWGVGWPEAPLRRRQMLFIALGWLGSIIVGLVTSAAYFLSYLFRTLPTIEAGIVLAFIWAMAGTLGGGVMFRQLTRSRRLPLSVYGRMIVLFLLLLGLFGLRESIVAAPSQVQTPPPPQVPVLMILLNAFPYSLFLTPVALVLILTTLRLGPQQFRRNHIAAWLEGVSVAAAPLSIGVLLILFLEGLRNWVGFWTIAFGVLLALLNLVRELLGQRGEEPALATVPEIPWRSIWSVVALGLIASVPAIVGRSTSDSTERLAVIFGGDVYVMQADGSHQVRLTNSSADSKSELKWSPNGLQIAFADRREANSEIYIADAKGTGLINLTQSLAEDTDPVWSPDSKQLAFVSKREGRSDIYVINADGSGQLRRLTNGPGDCLNPDWSPDGRQIAYVSWDGTVRTQIAVMNADGTGPPLSLTDSLTELPHIYYDPAWSPDGRRIAFSARVHEAFLASPNDIYVINVDGSGVINLTNNGQGNVAPVWSPNGQSIFYESRGLLSETKYYVVKADGSEQPQLVQMTQ